MSLERDGIVLAHAKLMNVSRPDADWLSLELEDAKLGHRAALSLLFGLTPPQLFDGCRIALWDGPLVLVHTSPPHFRGLPVRIQKLQLVLPLKNNYASWDDARLLFFEKTLAPGRGL